MIILKRIFLSLSSLVVLFTISFFIGSGVERRDYRSPSSLSNLSKSDEVPRDIYIVYGSTEGASKNESVLLSIPDGDSIPDRNQRNANVFHQLQERGYRVHIVQDIEIEHLIKIVSSDSTVAIFHHGHGDIVEDVNGSISYGVSVFNNGKNDQIMDGLVSQVSGDEYAPGENLKYYLFTGCFGEACGVNLKKELKLSKETKYIQFSGTKRISSNGISSAFSRGEEVRSLVESLPNIYDEVFMPLISTQDTSLEALSRVLEWGRDLNKRQKEEIFSSLSTLFYEHSSAILSHTDPDIVVGYLMFVANEESLFNHVIDNSFTQLADLLGHENYFVKKHVTKLLLKREALDENHTIQVINNIKLDKPKHVYFNYQYNRYHLRETSLKLLMTRDYFSREDYLAMIETFPQIEYLRRIIKTRSTNEKTILKEAILESISDNMTPKDQSIIEFYIEHFGKDSDLVDRLRKIVPKEDITHMVTVKYYLNEELDNMGLIRKQFSSFESLELRLKIIVTLGNQDSLTYENTEFLKSLFLNEHHSDIKIIKVIIGLFGKFKVQDEEVIEKLIEYVDSDYYSNVATKTLLSYESLNKSQMIALKKIYKKNNDNYGGYGQSKADRAKKIINNINSQMSCADRIKLFFTRAK